MPPTLLWVLKFDVKLGMREHYFQNYHIHVTFQIFGYKSWCFFDGNHWQNETSERFFEKLKNLICNAKWRKTISGSGARKTLNFWLRTYNVPEGSSANHYVEARRAEFDGTGWTGWTGWRGWTEYQKGPSIFFKLCGNIEHVYIYLYTK